MAEYIYDNKLPWAAVKQDRDLLRKVFHANPVLQSKVAAHHFDKVKFEWNYTINELRHAIDNVSYGPGKIPEMEITDYELFVELVANLTRYPGRRPLLSYPNYLPVEIKTALDHSYRVLNILEEIDVHIFYYSALKRSYEEIVNFIRDEILDALKIAFKYPKQEVLLDLFLDQYALHLMDDEEYLVDEYTYELYKETIVKV